MPLDPTIAALMQGFSFEGISEMAAAGTKLAAQAGSFVGDNINQLAQGVSSAVSGGLEALTTLAPQTITALTEVTKGVSV